MYIYGKWYDIAIASTCPWLKQHKTSYVMGIIMVEEGEQPDQIRSTATRERHGKCIQTSSTNQKTETPGKYFQNYEKWGVTMKSYIVHTNYDEYAVFLTEKMKGPNSTITAKLYGRTPELPQDKIDDFKQFALDAGIPEDSFMVLENRGECVPGTEYIKRVQRAVLAADEGSGDDGSVTKKEEACKLPLDTGDCTGHTVRYFYNSSSMACEQFDYGGCLGNTNNFYTEKECLQTCRTEAACRLPISTGPCRGFVKLWAFDSTNGKCVSFQYGGCKGNGNKFYTEKECKEYCGVQVDGEEEFLGVPQKS
ncbi:protein AMBP isoform X2 [Protopterus annectens]|uniref:protein AMBP isoform X2 n=1 Tax=Protopterus annectens TaxID=7888 RepID=UPI001CFB1EAF|nr:protein AMBP isoform X2 [Protopterus annectens]